MTKQQLLDHGAELADDLRGYCYCPGPTCSGCEEMSIKLHAKGFTAAVELLWPMAEALEMIDCEGKGCPGCKALSSLEKKVGK